MTREEHLEFCLLCTKKSFSPKHGVICSFTNEVAKFENNCPDFLPDEKELRRIDVQMEENLKEVISTINNARYVLFLLAAIYLLLGYFEGFVIDHQQILFAYIDWSIAAMFLGLGILSLYHPRPAMIAGLSLYVLITLIIALFDFTTMVEGFILKIVVIVGLVYGIKATHHIQQEQEPNSDDLVDR